jgi:hypothetical protein
MSAPKWDEYEERTIGERLDDFLDDVGWRWRRLRVRLRAFWLYTVLRRPRPEPPHFHGTIADMLYTTMAAAVFMSIVKNPGVADVIKSAGAGFENVIRAATLPGDEKSGRGGGLI